MRAPVQLMRVSVICASVICAVKRIVCYNLEDFAGYPPERYGYFKEEIG